MGEMEAPVPGAGEVRVQLAASGVNPVDVKRRRGGRGPMEATRVIPHFDGAGVIDRVGPGVPTARVGQRVWVYEAQWQRSFGTAAELVALPAERAVPLSKRTSFSEGACLGIPALTAHRCVFADGPVDGQTVMVTGGAGSVGAYAVQFAKLAGARVLATVSTAEKAARASECGADHCIDYKSEDVASRVQEITGGVGVDRIVEVEFGGNLGVSIEILKENGVIAAYASDAVSEPALPFYQLAYKNISIHHVVVFGMPQPSRREAIAEIPLDYSFSRSSTSRRHASVRSTWLKLNR